MLRVIDYFADSLTVTQDQSKWHNSIDRIRVHIGVHSNCALSFIISEINRDIGRKSRFFIPNRHSTSPLVGSRRNIDVRFGTEKKLELCGYPTIKKYENMFTRFDTDVTDRRTDGRTNRHRTTA